MQRNSIGRFIAVLRKANGMTQQEMADRLNVSNKAVSRWERDECSPDLTLIPAIAEMFGVSCDELLRGERLTGSLDSEKLGHKTDRQIKNLISRTLASMKTLIMISVCVASAGVICMFGISYGFYRPNIGFAVMLLMEAAAALIAAIAVIRAKEVRRSSELLERAGESSCAEFDAAVGNWAYGAAFGIVASVLLALPLVLFDTDFLNGVLSFGSYITLFFGFIVLLLAAIWILLKRRVAEYIATGRVTRNPKPKSSASAMTVLQTCLLLCAALVFLFAPYLQNPHKDGFSLFSAVVLFGLLCCAASILTVPVFILRRRGERREVLFYGARNLLLTVPVLLLDRAHYVSWSHTYFASIGSGEQTVRYYRTDHWNTEYIWIALALALSVIFLFVILKNLKKK